MCGSTTMSEAVSLERGEGLSTEMGEIEDDILRDCNIENQSSHFSFPSGTRNKIFDLGIFIGVQSKIFISWDAFSISFIRDPLFLVIDTLLPFSSKNEDKVVNTGILAAGEEQSSHLSSHRGLKALNESPMMIYEGDIPILDEMDIRQKDEKSSKKNKTEHGMKEQSKLKSTPTKSKVKVKAKIEEMLNGPTLKGCDLRLGSKAKLMAGIKALKPLTLKAQLTQ
ncbi:hypothetical protein Tco_0364910 [Tanacetum coccineum]